MNVLEIGEMDVTKLIDDVKFGYMHKRKPVDMFDNEFINIRLQHEVKKDWDDISYEDIGF